MITLYERSDCPFCWKVRIALAELGLEYRIEATRLGEKYPEVSRLSPTGTVPVLVDGDTAIWESGVILEYLDSRYAPGRLFPGDPAEQARLRLLHAYSDKVVGGCLRDLVFEKRSKPEREWDWEIIQASEKKWQACQAYMEGELGNKTFFGEGFSAADCALGARFGVAEAYGSNVSAEFPELQRWFGALVGRPAWKQAYPTSFIRTE
jgi:glutathione S-transferase